MLVSCAGNLVRQFIYVEKMKWCVLRYVEAVFALCVQVRQCLDLVKPVMSARAQVRQFYVLG